MATSCSALARRCLLIRVITVSTLTWTPLLGPTAVQASYCMPVMPGVCTYPQWILDIYRLCPRHVLIWSESSIRRMFHRSPFSKTLPPSRLPPKTQSRGTGCSCLSQAEKCFALTAAPAHPDKLSTCFVRKLSPQAL